MHRVKDFAGTFLIAEKLINVKEKVISDVIKKVAHKSQRYYWFAKLFFHTFYYFWLV